MSRPPRKSLYLAAWREVYQQLYCAGIWLDPARSLGPVEEIVDDIAGRRADAWSRFKDGDAAMVNAVVVAILDRVEGRPAYAPHADRGAS